MISIKLRWLGLILAAVIAGPAFAAEPDFSTSTVIHEPVKVVAGDVVRYTVTVTNTGGDAGYAGVTTALPRGYFIRASGDCATATPDEGRRLSWQQGRFATGATRQCQVDVLTRRDAAGTSAPFVTEISMVPSGYHRVEAAPVLATPPHPNIVRTGAVGITRAGLVVIALLGIALVGAVIVMAATRSGGRTIALGAWLAVVISVGFLFIFVGLAHNDLRSYTDYRETSCSIFDSTIRAVQGSGNRSRSNTYAPEFAVRYAALGTEIYASAEPPASAVSFGWIGHSQRELDRFAVGSVQPCWFDPDDVRTVLLTRGPGGAYLFALLPLAALIVFTWVLLASLRPNKRRDRTT